MGPAALTSAVGGGAYVLPCLISAWSLPAPTLAAAPPQPNYGPGSTRRKPNAQLTEATIAPRIR